MTLSRKTRGTRLLLSEHFNELNPFLDLNTAEDKIPKGKWPHLKNVSNTRATGNMATRRGYARCNSTDLAATIDGIHTFYRLNSKERLYVQGGGFYKVTTDWESPVQIDDSGGGALALTAGDRVVFSTIALPNSGVALINQSDGLYIYDGTDATATAIPKANAVGNITGARLVMFHPNGRLLVGGNLSDASETNIIYWSDTITPLAPTPDFTTGADSGGGYSTLYQGRSSLANTGIAYQGDDILAWTESGFYRVRDWDKFDAAGIPAIPDIKEISADGCIAPDSIRRWRNYWLWVSRNGVMMWNGGLPRNISMDLFPGIAYNFNPAVAALLDCFAVIHDDQYRLTYDNTLDAGAKNSRTLVFDFKGGGWFHEYNTPFRCGYAAQSGDDLLQRAFYGSDDASKGYIWTWGETDDQAPVPVGNRNTTIFVDDFAPADNPETGDSILIEARTDWFNFGNPTSTKRMEHIEVEFDTGDGGGDDITPAITDGKIFFYANDNETPLGSVTIDSAKKFQRLYFPDTVDLYFRKMKVMFSATCTNRQITFKRFIVYARDTGGAADTT